jgi:hypothetical protein
MQFSLTEMMAIGTELFVSNRMLVRPMISVWLEGFINTIFLPNSFHPFRISMFSRHRL